MKKGFYTSEFFVAVVTAVAIAGCRAAGFPLSEAEVAGLVTAAVSYIANRGWVKGKGAENEGVRG